MTRRERMEARVERRRQWAQARHAEAAQRFGAAHRIADGIPLGQPILVGHHSERHARRDQERIHSNMSKAVEAERMEFRHESVADTLEARLETTVFSDDANASEALQQRISEREAQAERIKALNVAIRAEFKRGLPAGWIERIGATQAEQQAILRNVQFDYRHQPMFPGYVLTNLRGRITVDRERLKAITAQAVRSEEAEAAGGVVIAKHPEHNWCRVTFAEKPDRSILDALRAAGFRWGSGSWQGYVDRLPQAVEALSFRLQAER
ncbi:MAG: DUF3560 domain-containing protein [Candidatus Rokuibacteriota bacterium]